MVWFEEGSTRVPPDFQVLRGLQGGPRWFEVRFHEGSTRFPPRFHQPVVLRTRVPPGFHQFLRGCGVVRGRFHEGSTRVSPCRVPPAVRAGLRQCSMRIPPEFLQGIYQVRFHSSTVLAGSHEVLRGLRGGPGWFEMRARFCEGCGP